jgi:Na+-transporting NADH:ubiquinone oxidoreductase subunit D
MILITVAFGREILGSGTLFGYQLIPDAAYAAGYQNMGLMVLAPGAFILLGLIIWVQRTITGVAE